MRWRLQPETSTHDYESVDEYPVRIMRDALMMATGGGRHAFMIASTKINAIMKSLARI